MSVVELEDVGKEYRNEGESVPALRGVSLKIEPGEFVALTGRSGCGKSTLLNLCGAMDFPTSGRVLLNDVCTTGLTDAALTALRRKTVGFIFQSFQLLQNLTAVENVELPLLLAGSSRPRERALQSLAWVEMEGLDGRFPHQLSGGQQQRVAIARALVHEPSLILADEPIGNLDSATGEVVLRLLRRIATERRTAIVMATHSRESAEAVDVVVQMRDGRIETVLRN